MYKFLYLITLILFIIFNFSCDPTDTVDALENPDLTMHSFFISPTEATTEDSVTFHCIVKNLGLGTSDPTTLTLKGWITNLQKCFNFRRDEKDNG